MAIISREQAQRLALGIEFPNIDSGYIGEFAGIALYQHGESKSIGCIYATSVYDESLPQHVMDSAHVMLVPCHD